MLTSKQEAILSPDENSTQNSFHFCGSEIQECGSRVLAFTVVTAFFLPSLVSQSVSQGY